MPYKNKQDRISNSKEYYIKNKEKIKLYVYSWVKKNKDRCRSYAHRSNLKRVENGKSLAHYYKNKEKILEQQKHWRKRFPEKSKNQMLKKKYGISLEFFNQALLEQGRKCACCATFFTDKIKPNVDHCHETGTFRSILCRPCNLIEGWLNKLEKEKERVVMVNRYRERFSKPQIDLLRA